MKRISVYLTVLILLFSVSCSGASKTPEDVTTPTTPTETPSQPGTAPDTPSQPSPDEPSDPGTGEETPSDPETVYVIAGQADLMEIRNDNVPYFTSADYEKAEAGYFMELSPLDSLGRVGANWGCFDYAHMPTEERTSLKTNPTGWVQKEYDSSIIPTKWIWNRSHVLGFMISSLNDVPENLMTGTRAFNAGENSMVTFENMTADHMREYRDHHVLYRVTPDFADGCLVAFGVLMESDCLECDDTADFCVYILNQQNGITIDYRTGDNWLTDSDPEPDPEPVVYTYILNTGTKKFHLLTCSRAPEASSSNYSLTTLLRGEVISEGYSPCSICKP